MKILFFFFILVIQILAVDISDIKSKDSLYKYMNYDTSENNNLEFSLESKNQIQKKLEKSNFGNVPFYVYTLLNITNNTSEKKEFILINPRAGLDEINSFVIYSNKSVNFYKQGDNHPVENRPINNRYSNIYVELEPNESVEILSQCKTMGTMEVDWLFYTVNDFYNENSYELIFLSFIVGVVFALVIYNLTMYFAMKDKIYILYVFIAISFIIHQLCLKGVLYILTLSDGNFLSKLIFAAGLMGVFFILWFNTEFFNIKKTQPKLHFLINIVKSLILFYVAIFYIMYETNYGILIIRNISIIFSLVCILIIYIIIINLLKDFKNTILYILGQLSFVIFIIIQYLMLWGVIKHNSFLAKDGILLGIAVDLVVISIALGYKIRILNLQKNKNEKLALINSRYTSVGKLLGNISHQWKNPLVDLSAYIMKIETIYNMKPDLVNDVLKESLPQMNKTLQFMGNCVDEFNNLARVDREKELFKLDEIIDDLQGLLSARLSLNNGKIVYEANSNILIHGYPLSLSQVFIILIENSLDAAKRKTIQNPTIKIKVESQKQKIIINIEDNCGGISEEPIEKIFEIFETSKIDNNSSGIGLQIAQMIIEEQFNGKLNVRNIKNGSKFIIYLSNS